MNFDDFSNGNLRNNPGAKQVFDYLTEPLNIHNMIVFSDVGLPAISGIVSNLEKRFQNNSTFPLNDFTNRQTVGRMVKYILKFFGYAPVAGGLDERARLRNFSNAHKFKTASVYSLTTKPNYQIKAALSFEL